MPEQNDPDDRFNPGILPLKFLVAYTANLAVVDIFNISLPANYNEMFSVGNIAGSFLKTGTTIAAMNIPWTKLNTLNTQAGWRECLPQFTKECLIGLIPFTIEAMIGSVIRFSLPPTLTIEILLRAVNAFITATVLDHIVNKNMRRERYLQAILILVFKQFSGDVENLLMNLLAADLDEGFLEDVLQMATHITTNILIPPAAGFFGAPLIMASMHLPEAVKKCAGWGTHGLNSIKGMYGSFFKSKPEEAKELTTRKDYSSPDLSVSV